MNYLVPNYVDFDVSLGYSYSLVDELTSDDYISGEIIFSNKKGTIDFKKGETYILCVDFDNDADYCFRHFLRFNNDKPNFDVNPYNVIDLHEILIMRINNISDSIKLSEPYIKFEQNQIESNVDGGFLNV